jgi:hypothetical protein
MCLHLQDHLGGNHGGGFYNLMGFLRPHHGALVLAFLGLYRPFDVCSFFGTLAFLHGRRQPASG